MYLWSIEQPAAAVANEYFVGAINRVGIEDLGDNDFYGSTYFVNPRGQYVDDVASAVFTTTTDADASQATHSSLPSGVSARLSGFL